MRTNNACKWWKEPAKQKRAINTITPFKIMLLIRQLSNNADQNKSTQSIPMPLLHSDWVSINTQSTIKTFGVAIIVKVRQYYQTNTVYSSNMIQKKSTQSSHARITFGMSQYQHAIMQSAIKTFILAIIVKLRQYYQTNTLYSNNMIQNKSTQSLPILALHSDWVRINTR